MRYMRGLNEWLARDVHDRQSELRGVSARVDQLRNDLGRYFASQPAGMHTSIVYLRITDNIQAVPPLAVLPAMALFLSYQAQRQARTETKDSSHPVALICLCLFPTLVILRASCPLDSSLLAQSYPR